MVPKLRKFDCETEDPWRYMADLPLEHASTMRRVMVLIYHKLNPSEKLNLPDKFSWIYLTKNERKRVKAMLQESNNNDLLLEILQWFSAKHRAEDEEVVDATEVLRCHVVNAVRQPRLYQVEYLEERERWYEFISKEDSEMGGVGELSTSVSRPSEFITSARQVQVNASANQRSTKLSKRRQRQELSLPAIDKQQRGLPMTSKRQLQPAVPSIFTAEGPQSFAPKIQRQGPSLTGRSQEKRPVIDTVNNYDITDEDATTLTDPSSEEEVNIFVATMLPGSPKKTRSGAKFATSSQDSSKQIIGSASRSTKGVSQKTLKKTIGSSSRGGKGVSQESLKKTTASASRSGKDKTTTSRVKVIKTAKDYK